MKIHGWVTLNRAVRDSRKKIVCLLLVWRGWGAIGRNESLLLFLYPWGYKTFFMLNSAEHEIFSANKYENAKNSWHFHIYYQRNVQLCLSRNYLQFLVIWDLLTGQISCSAELCMKKSFIISSPGGTIEQVWDRTLSISTTHVLKLLYDWRLWILKLTDQVPSIRSERDFSMHE